MSEPFISPNGSPTDASHNSTDGATDTPFNAFSILHILESFDLCLKNLDLCYEHAQTLIHPDQWSSDMGKRLAAQHAVRCNQAYGILKNPETRAAHMLQLRGHWPVPDFPDLFAIVLDWYEHGHHPEALDLAMACTAFSTAWSEGNIAAAQRAYWWIKVGSKKKPAD